MVTDASGLWEVPFPLVELPPEPAIGRLGGLRVPTLVLVGADDMAMIRSLAERLEREVPGARRVVVPGGGHLLNLTSARAFREAVEAFLAGQDTAR
jgi:pimeloyl-ACP methyl ester carboxylesterase